MKEITTTQNIQNFVFGESGGVQTIFKNGDPFFRLRDIVTILEIDISTASKWIERGWFDPDEMVELTNCQVGVEGGGRPVKFISESALYRILNRSEAPKAKEFERWVTKEVLPSIRKTGSYAIKAPTTLLEALELAVEQQKQILKLEAQNQSQAHCIEYQKGVLQNYKEVEKSYRHKAELAKRLNDTIRLYAQQKLNKDYGLAYNTIYGLFAKRHHIKDKINMAYLKKNIDYLAECLSIVSAELDLVDVKEIL